MDLSFLALLMCPLMLIFMFIMMKGMQGKNNQGNHPPANTRELQQNVAKLMEQNEKLSKEIETMKRYR